MFHWAVADYLNPQVSFFVSVIQFLAVVLRSWFEQDNKSSQCLRPERHQATPFQLQALTSNFNTTSEPRSMQTDADR